MDSGWGDDVLTQAMWVVDQRYAELEREAARALIEGAFASLPFELQEDYREIMELHQAGRIEEANQLWEQWMATAREMGLI